MADQPIPTRIMHTASPLDRDTLNVANTLRQAVQLRWFLHIHYPLAMSQGTDYAGNAKTCTYSSRSTLHSSINAGSQQPHSAYTTGMHPVDYLLHQCVMILADNFLIHSLDLLHRVGW